MRSLYNKVNISGAGAALPRLLLLLLLTTTTWTAGSGALAAADPSTPSIVSGSNAVQGRFKYMVRLGGGCALNEHG
jgi:hypothetical protein